MDLDEMIRLARNKRGDKPYMRNMHLVQDWWPKPKIRIIDKMYWGTKHSNNRGILHKFECWSFSTIGFHSGGYRGVQDDPHLPDAVCLAYGESPEQAYDHWCEIFKSWNEKEEWV